MARTHTPIEPTTSSGDGRTERRERTRLAIANALLALFEEGNLRPTAPRVAERAGVSLRSVFQHFDDMESVYAAVAERQIERVLATAKFIPRDGPLPLRIDEFTAERARIHEAVTPVRRAALLMEPFSQEIADRLRWVRNRGHLEAGRVFRQEIALRPTAKRRDLLEALTAASSWSTWESLRAHQGLSAAKAQRVMRLMVTSLLTDHDAEGK